MDRTETDPGGLEYALWLLLRHTEADGPPVSFPCGESTSAPQQPRLNEKGQDYFEGTDDSWKWSENREFRSILCSVRRDRLRGIETAETGSMIVSIHGHLTREALGGPRNEALSLPHALVVDNVARRDVVAAVDYHVMV